MTRHVRLPLAILLLSAALLPACNPPTATFALTAVTAGSGTGSITASGEPSSDGTTITCQSGQPADCASEYDEGAQVTLTAAPGPNSSFTGWSGACTGAALTCQVTMSQAQTVTAQFNLIEDAFQVSLTGTGGGTVTSTPDGINCGNYAGAPNQCSETVDQGGTVTLTATPQPGSRFSGWSGGLGCTGSTCAVDVTRAVTVTATFDVIQLTAPLVSTITQGEQAQGQLQALGLGYYIAAFGVFPSQGSGMNSSGSPYLGQIMLFAGNFAPSGWLPCNGALLPINQNQALFALIGTTYGGDGRTNFAVPDLRDRVAMGAGALSNPTVPTGPGTSVVPVISSISEGATGQGQVNALGVNYYIALSGVYPSQGGGGVSTTDYYLGELMLFAGGFAPGGWAATDGRLLAINTNQALFSLLGTMYGGDGRVTFALPDLRARVPMGSGALTSPGSPPQSDVQVPLIPSISWGGTGQGQAGVLGMNYVIALNGIYPPQGGGGGGSIAYVGELMLFAGGFTPSGWAATNGALLNISSNTALFSLLGTTYGGNGTNNFALPDLRSRVVIGSP